MGHLIRNNFKIINAQICLSAFLNEHFASYAHCVTYFYSTTQSTHQWENFLFASSIVQFSFSSHKNEKDDVKMIYNYFYELIISNWKRKDHSEWMYIVCVLIKKNIPLLHFFFESIFIIITVHSSQYTNKWCSLKSHQRCHQGFPIAFTSSHDSFVIR